MISVVTSISLPGSTLSRVTVPFSSRLASSRGVTFWKPLLFRTVTASLYFSPIRPSGTRAVLTSLPRLTKTRMVSPSSRVLSGSAGSARMTRPSAISSENSSWTRGRRLKAEM